MTTLKELLDSNLNARDDLIASLRGTGYTSGWQTVATELSGFGKYRGRITGRWIDGITSRSSNGEEQAKLFIGGCGDLGVTVAEFVEALNRLHWSAISAKLRAHLARHKQEEEKKIPISETNSQTSLQDFLTKSPELRQSICNELSQSNDWYDTAVKLSKHYSKIDGDWIRDVEMNASPQNNLGRASQFIIRCMGLGVRVRDFAAAVDAIGKQILSDTILEHLARYEGANVAPVHAVPIIGASPVVSPSPIIGASSPPLYIYRWERIRLASGIVHMSAVANNSESAIEMLVLKAAQLGIAERESLGLELRLSDPVTVPVQGGATWITKV